MINTVIDDYTSGNQEKNALVASSIYCSCIFLDKFKYHTELKNKDEITKEKIFFYYSTPDKQKPQCGQTK